MAEGGQFFEVIREEFAAGGEAAGCGVDDAAVVQGEDGGVGVGGVD